MEKMIEDALRKGQEVLQMCGTDVMEVSQKGPMGILCIVAAAYSKGQLDAYDKAKEIVAS